MGYSPNGELKKSIVPPGGGATIHVYNTIPESITWELTEISQKDIKFLIGKAKVCEIDAVSSVPSLPEELSSAETGKRVLNSNLGRSEWQRRVDPKRILAIDEFIRLPNNIIANSAILYAPEGQGAISCSNDGEVTIDFAKFLRQSKEDWMDHWFNEDKTDLSADLRPMWLIDGQHRTRGLSQNEVGSEMEIPIILFTDDFSLNQSAKVFAEINTLQKPLDKLHELFMQHRFKIPTKTSKRDFRPWNVNDSETWNSRQNNLAYECAGWLTSRKNGPLYNRIKILDSNQPRYTIIKANSWVDYSRYWFRSTPYGPDCDKTKTEMFQEVENYFQKATKWPPIGRLFLWLREGPNLNYDALSFVRVYFGQKYAMFFAWVEYTTTWMIVGLALPGLVFYIINEVLQLDFILIIFAITTDMKPFISVAPLPYILFFL